MKPEWIKEGNAVYGIDQDCVLDKKKKRTRQERVRVEKRELQKLRQKVSELSRKWEWDKKKLHQAGVRGQGVCVAVIDTGIFRHPDLEGRITGFWDFQKGECACRDENGHGTQETELKTILRKRKLWYNVRKEDIILRDGFSAFTAEIPALKSAGGPMTGDCHGIMSAERIGYCTIGFPRTPRKYLR